MSSDRPLPAHLKNPDGSPRFKNRLAGEASPYLLQHAHNPVDWMPWGDEAFELARAGNKPVLLSVGYSSCHWCHVMERESFEDEEIAAVLNADYVAVKVDREQRPDVDAVYMAAVVRITGSGGWPLTVWLTPERLPFFGGTYFPARDGDRGMSPGFLTLLGVLSEMCRLEPTRVAAQAEALRRAMEDGARLVPGSHPPGASVLDAAFEGFASSYDSRFGGFGPAPKFPRPAVLRFLFTYGRRTGNASAVRMGLHTLREMARGGLYDHVGGGFHRYATDREWSIPHFEKMLYDNAQLVLAYLDAYQLSGEAEFAETAREVLDYLDRDMRSPEGGFYSATDADSEGREGAFFVWTPAEIDRCLGPERGRIFKEAYGVTDAGNFEGLNILHRTGSLSEIAFRLGIAPEVLKAELSASRRALREARQRRPAPSLDDKILTGSNGLAVAALARAAFVLDEKLYRTRAEEAAGFLLTRLFSGNRLLRSYAQGRAEIDAYLDDHAFFAFGLLHLFEATGETDWLERARDMAERMIADFHDEREGGFHFTGIRHEKLPVREKPFYDGAEPSGNSVAATVLLRLEALTGETRYGDIARRVFAVFAPAMKRMPAAAPFLLSALDWVLDRPREILLVRPAESRDAEDLLAVLRRAYLPNAVIAVTDEGRRHEKMAGIVPWACSRGAVDGRPTVYICERGSCGLPMWDPKAVEKALEAAHQ